VGQAFDYRAASAGVLHVLRKPLLDETGGLANLQRWGATMAARPGVARGMQVLG
jgi:hypothetical protein